jgi:hypothetical protein
MRVMLSELAHFNKAKRYRGPLLIAGAILASFGLMLIGALSAQANVNWLSGVPVPASFAYLGAALLVAAAGFLSAGMLTAVRHRSLVTEPLQNTQGRQVPPSRRMLKERVDLKDVAERSARRSGQCASRNRRGFYYWPRNKARA